MKRLSNERGLALVSALLSVALLTLIVVEMTDSTLLHTNLARNAGNAMAAQLLARSAAVGGEAILIEDKTQYPNVTARNGYWAFDFPPFPAGPGTIILKIEDEGGKLDLNQIAKQRDALKNLFGSLGLEPEGLLDSIQDWISTPEQAAASGVAGAAECALPIPCTPPHSPLRSIDDLRLIRGFDERTIALLRPHVTANVGGKSNLGVNVNTASPLVLQALGCGVPNDFQQKAEGYEDLAAFKEDASCEDVDNDLLRLASDLFSITAAGEVGDAMQTVRTIVERSSGKVTRLSWFERPISEPPPETLR